MANRKVNNIQLPQELIYKMTTIRTTNDNSKNRSLIGELWTNPIRVGSGVIIGTWQTSPVREIELKSKGKVLIKTMNTDYLLEEMNKLSDIGQLKD